MTEHLCDYGNCEETRVVVRVNYNGQRKTFCCVDHAAMWLLRQQYPYAEVTLGQRRKTG